MAHTIKNYIELELANKLRTCRDRRNPSKQIASCAVSQLTCLLFCTKKLQCASYNMLLIRKIILGVNCGFFQVNKILSEQLLQNGRGKVIYMLPEAKQVFLLKSRELNTI